MKIRGVVGLANKQSPIIFPAGFNYLTIKVLTEETQEFCVGWYTIFRRSVPMLHDLHRGLAPWRV